MRSSQQPCLLYPTRRGVTGHGLIWHACDMDEDHLQASASQEHNPDMSCCENWVPAYGTKVGDLN